MRLRRVAAGRLFLTNSSNFAAQMKLDGRRPGAPASQAPIDCSTM
ncbi:hypothetical protein AIOL_004583 [Candidatus Rhodobacter oscarellae]|uniref:Uncharacterized protein n=1 Tax=Candidatus Rhodobacter oscarellae TaxID=1675527 RepID=A0A0J9EAE2_9RHOB|nr:hypothetical protein AIOL_004583 [Candidatus Rhodobacter lobularis]